MIISSLYDSLLGNITFDKQRYYSKNYKHFNWKITNILIGIGTSETASGFYYGAQSRKMLHLHFYRVCLSHRINTFHGYSQPNIIVFSDAATSFNLSPISDGRQIQSGIQIDRHTQTHRLVYRYQQYTTT